VSAPDPLDAFFAEYAARVNRALADPPEEDVEETAGAFARCFVEASPAGINCGQNDAGFREMIPKGYAFYRSIGTKSMTIIALTKTPLDERHTMVKVHWKALYSRPGGAELPIEFDVIYFLQAQDRGPKIFAYVTGDEQQVLRDHGLLPREGGPGTEGPASEGTGV
jgi:hypothetical protein